VPPAGGSQLTASTSGPPRRPRRAEPGEGDRSRPRRAPQNEGAVTTAAKSLRTQLIARTLVGMRPLTPREARFCEEYQIDFCAAKAAERAGYSAKWSKSIGSRLLGRPAVAAAVREAGIKHSGVVGVKIETVLHELQLIAYRDTEKTSDRLKALELLGRHCGAFTEESVRVVGVTLEDLVPRRRSQPPGEAPKALPVPSPASPAAPSTPPTSPEQLASDAVDVAPAPEAVAEQLVCAHDFGGPHGICLRCRNAWRPSPLPWESGARPHFAEGAGDPLKHFKS